jgi:hypothetical protein
LVSVIAWQTWRLSIDVRTPFYQTVMANIYLGLSVILASAVPFSKAKKAYLCSGVPEFHISPTHSNDFCYKSSIPKISPTILVWRCKCTIRFMNYNWSTDCAWWRIPQVFSLL